MHCMHHHLYLKGELNTDNIQVSTWYTYRIAYTPATGMSSAIHYELRLPIIRKPVAPSLLLYSPLSAHPYTPYPPHPPHPRTQPLRSHPRRPGLWSHGNILRGLPWLLYAPLRGEMIISVPGGDAVKHGVRVRKIDRYYRLG